LKRYLIIVLILVLLSCARKTQEPVVNTVPKAQEVVPAAKLTTCGDGVCSDEEVGGNCPADCSPPPEEEVYEPSCGDGICSEDELVSVNCDLDCTQDVPDEEVVQPACGNGICEENEIVEQSCSQDCG
jgi:hypothetical protein